MPALNLNRKRDVREKLLLELRVKQAECGLMSVSSLASAAGIPKGIMYRNIQDPEKFSAEHIQAIIHTLHPDPGVMLAWLGYTPTEITKWRKTHNDNERI